MLKSKWRSLFSNVRIAPYEEGNIWNQDPERREKIAVVLESKLKKLEQETKGTGMTLVPSQSLS